MNIIDDMSLKASGSYLQRLRDNAGLSRAELAEKLGTSPSQIFRIEEGKGETRGSLLAAFIRMVSGSAEDVVTLILDSRAGEEEGVRTANIWLEQHQEAPIYRSSIHPDVVDLAGRLSDYELGRWVAVGQRIIEERNKVNSVLQTIKRPWCSTPGPFYLLTLIHF